jgi:pyruvate,water dikinase
MAADLPGLEIHLTTGYGSMEEGRSLEDLWEVSQGQRELSEFIQHHGYHGPLEGELSSIVWREDPRPVRALLDRFAEMDPAQAPVARAAAQRRDAQAATSRLLESVGPARRPVVRALLTATGRYSLLREVGKASYLQSIDGARFAARVIGDRLVDIGVVENRDDVFFLTHDELRRAHEIAAPELVVERRAVRNSYSDFEVPEHWTGQLTLDDVGTTSCDTGGNGLPTVTGVGVSPGIVEGRAAVILDAATSGDLVQPGDIVVCPWTDPSWAPTMLISSAFVIDTGGVLSHGAIIARELGVPCVIGTVEATKRLRTGDQIRVDGDAGTIEVLTRSDA